MDAASVGLDVISQKGPLPSFAMVEYELRQHLGWFVHLEVQVLSLLLLLLLLLMLCDDGE